MHYLFFARHDFLKKNSFTFSEKQLPVSSRFRCTVVCFISTRLQKSTLNRWFLPLLISLQNRKRVQKRIKLERKCVTKHVDELEVPTTISKKPREGRAGKPISICY